MLLSAHTVETAFTTLAKGGGDPDTIRLLRDAQLGKHLLLLHAIAETATGHDPGAATFRAGYECWPRSRPLTLALLPGCSALPHMGGWAHDCLVHLDQGGTADLAYFACLAATAAIRLGCASNSTSRCVTDVSCCPASVAGIFLAIWRGPAALRW